CRECPPDENFFFLGDVIPIRMGGERIGAVLPNSGITPPILFACRAPNAAGRASIDQNLIERYRADIRLLDLPEEIAQCIRPWPGPGASAMFQSLRPVPLFAGPANRSRFYRGLPIGATWVPVAKRHNHL